MPSNTLLLPLLILLLSTLNIFTKGSGEEVHTACKQEGNFAFTFDQGPSQYTGLLLRTLEKHRVKATFHVSADYLQNPVIVAYLRRAAIEGHLIGLRVKESVSEDEEKLKAYLQTSAAAIKRHTNYEPQYLRFPLGGPDPKILSMVTKMGYTVTGYNLDSQDYNAISERNEKEGSVFRAFKAIEDMIDPPASGSFISIQSDLVEASVQQSDAIIAYTIKKGYKPVRMDQCLQQPQPAKKDEETSDEDDGAHEIYPASRNHAGCIECNAVLIVAMLLLLAFV